MGKLEEALEKAGGAGGQRSGGLGGAVGQGGVRLQKGRPGTSAEEQVAGEDTLPGDEAGEGEGERAMPTSPEAGRVPE